MFVPLMSLEEIAVPELYLQSFVSDDQFMSESFFIYLFINDLRMCVFSFVLRIFFLFVCFQ